MSDCFLSRLAQARPDPGGGSACAHAALLGLALLKKVDSMELRSGSWLYGPGKDWPTLMNIVQKLGSQFLDLREKDTQAYLNMVEARRSGDTDERFADALAQAIECPCLIIDASTLALDCLLQAVRNCRRHLLPDLMAAAEFLAAAANGAAHIVKANVEVVPDSEERRRWSSRLDISQNDLRSKIETIRGARAPSM